MSSAIDLKISKELIGTIIEMEINKATAAIRKESSDDKDKVILANEEVIAALKKENASLHSTIREIKSVVGRT